MKSVRRLAQVWGWLPAFRAVAEAEHLPTASRELNLSTSALSRAVRLLEDRLGHQLFVRDGKRLLLSPAGELLLTVLREAMRRVDDGLERLSDSEMTGPVRVSAAGALAALFVLPALRALGAQHPGLVPTLASVEPHRVPAQLRDGSLDIALVDRRNPDADFSCHPLGRLPGGLYCSPENALAGRQSVTLEDIDACDFIGPPPEEGLNDGFPVHLRRNVSLVVAQLSLAMQACATSRLLAHLPRALAESYQGEGSLVRLPIELGSMFHLYALCRGAPVSRRVSALHHAVRDAIAKKARVLRPGSIELIAEPTRSAAE